MPSFIWASVTLASFGSRLSSAPAGADANAIAAAPAKTLEHFMCPPLDVECPRILTRARLKRRSRTSVRESAAMRNQAVHTEVPDEPWRRRHDWRVGRVPFHVPVLALVLLWGFAGLWNGFTLLVGGLMLFLAPDASSRAGILAFLGLFLAAGLIPIVMAWRATARRRRFGHSTFEMARIPFALGDRVEGWVHAPAALSEASAIRVALDCVDVPSIQSDSSSTVLWRDQVSVPLSAIDF